MSISLIVLAAVLLMMLAELQLSRHNTRVLRERGATEPPGDVYRLMQVAYPAIFVVMAVEGALTGPSSFPVIGAGLILFGASKALKFSAIIALGVRWSYRVLVLRGQPLVQAGPYRYLRHPNYVAVMGEIVSVALAVHAPVTGPLAVVLFGWLLWRRIGVEERALRGPSNADCGM